MSLFQRYLTKNKNLLKNKKCIFYQQNSLSEVFVYENTDFRWLMFNKKFIQTLIYKPAPEQAKMAYIVPLCNLLVADQRILLLGTGGGAIIHYLLSQLKEFTLTTVESNPLVIKLAKEYFYLPSLNIIEQDALHFLATSTCLFDAILVDIFVHDLSDILQQKSFLLALRQRSTEIVSFNLLGSDLLKKMLIIKIREIFNSQTLIIACANGNTIIHAAKKSIKPFIEKLESSEKIKNLAYDISSGFIAMAWW